MENPQLTEEVNQLHAEICAALAEPRRIVLLYALAEKPRNVTELVNALNMTQPTASRHLKILRERGLVRAARQGATVEYCLTDHRLIDALDLLRAVLRDRLNYRASLLEETEEPAELSSAA